jgi:hypothetical protein
LKALSTNPFQQLRAAMGSSASSGTTRELGGGELAQLGAGILGGGLASIGGNKKPPQVKSEDLAAKAAERYSYADEKGGLLRPEVTNKFIDDIQKLAPQTEMGKVMSGDSPFTKIVDKISSIRDKPISLAGAQEFDEGLSEAIEGLLDNGRPTKAARKVMDIQSTFRKAVETSPEEMVIGGKEGFQALKEGRQLWSKSRKLADVERIIARAELSDNPATVIKSGFKTLLLNKNRTRGFSKEELEAVKKAASSGIVSDTARVVFGSRLIPIISTATGGAGAGLAAQGASMASRGISNKAQLGRASALADLIANGKQPKQSNSALRLLGTAQGLNATTQRGN